MASSADTLRQRLPIQDLARLTLVTPQPKKLREWVEALPMVNVGETSRQVFLTLQEINRLNLDPASRFELLEILRPTVHTLNKALSKHYLNQSIMLPERATKVATLAQAMQNHLASGYKLIVVHLLDKLLGSTKRDIEAIKLLAQAIHRAVTELSGNLLRSTQLYLNTPTHLWLELHALYLAMVEQNLTEVRVTDTLTNRLSEKSTLEDAYKRALLLSTSKPNKLRQTEIAQVYEMSEQWAPLISLHLPGTSGVLFVFDLTKDAAPTYRVLAQSIDADHTRAIDSSSLVIQLNELRQSMQASVTPNPGTASATLLAHLAQAWGELSERSFSRISHDGVLDICLGLTPLHYYIAGGRDFDVMMQGKQALFSIADADNPFLKAAPITQDRPDTQSGKDVWSLAFGNADVKARDDELNRQLHSNNAPRHDIYHSQIVNISPGGYCVEWSGEVPSGVRSGEILGLKEEGQANWNIGVIRWVKQLPGHGAQLGIEILAPKARPCGARVLKKTGDASEYMRALLLPELKAINRPATLILPTLTFRTGYKILLNLDGDEPKAQLTTQVSATPSFSQFEFQLLRRPGEAEPEAPTDSDSGSGGDEEDFDSIWASL